jgi:flagellar hook protein FlgE
MSLFGALNTAVSGLTAQSAAFGNISDNVANSQSVGFKGVDTSFIDYLTTSTTTTNDPGSVVARPDYTNAVQGTVSQSSDPLALAISGQGFFAVAESNGTTAAGLPSFDQQPYFTRAGDFTTDKNGFLVNSANEYLEGWTIDPTTGTMNQAQTQPIQVSNAPFKAIATANAAISANLPTTPSSNTAMSSQMQVYDAAGNLHTLTLGWTPPAQGSTTGWGLSVTADGGTTPIATTTLQFAADGTISGVGGTPGTAGQPATLALSPTFGATTQNITLNLGTFGQANGVTEFAGTTYSLNNLSQDGVPAGNFTGTSITANGAVVASYDNGKTVTVAQVPLVTFANPDALQRQNGQAFTATTQSGTAISKNPNSDGAGQLITGSVESSNVDIATEFSKLIVAQQAYGAAAKIVTSADQMLQTTINMKQ